MAVLHSAPKFASNEGVLDALTKALGKSVITSQEEHGEIILTVKRDEVAAVLETLRDDHDYQQLMEIAGVDYPQRPERFEVVYMLLSLTKNHRIMVKCSTDEATPVPTVTTLWPNAGWLWCMSRLSLRKICANLILKALGKARITCCPAMKRLTKRRRAHEYAA